MPPTSPIDGANALAASQFVALVFSLVANIVLLRLYMRSLDSQDNAWKQVRELGLALKDSTSLIEKFITGRSRGSRA